MTSRSDAVFNPKCYTNDNWVVHICENLLPAKELEELQKSHGVSVCQVPKWLSSAKPEAFIPQFVGLGPYHHFRAELIMTDKLKLAAAKRALNHHLRLESEEKLRQHLKTFVSHSDTQAFYHIDVSSAYNCDTLFHVLTIDGLFLLGLLHTHRAATAKPEQEYSYFLTGKHGMALVNAAGLELTMDFIISDVFMVENQIPTHFLKQIKEAVISNGEDGEVQSLGEVIYGDLGLDMKRFCEALCPFAHFEELSKNPEAHDHLLDLVYHLIAREPEPEPDSVPMTQPEPEPEPEPQSSEGNGVQDDEQTCCFRCAVAFILILASPMLVVWAVILVVCGVMYCILKLLLWMLKSLVRVVRWTLHPLCVQLVKLSKFIKPMAKVLYDLISMNDPGLSYQKVKPWAEVIGEKSTNTNEKDGQEMDVHPAVKIPSVMKLHDAGIHFQPASGGISTIEFDHINCQFRLPIIKLDVNSEVIIRNLVAYESLTKSKGLIFTRYVELMKAIIKTPYDVKLLVHEKIIHTELRDEVVAQLFKGMRSKSIRPTKTPKLEQVINKVIAKFESTQALNRLLTKYVYSSWKFFTTVGALIFLLLTAAETYCSIFDCARTRT